MSAQKLYDMLARVKAGSEAAKQREVGRGLKRQADLISRLQKAEDARYEKMQAVTSSLAVVSFLSLLIQKSRVKMLRKCAICQSAVAPTAQPVFNLSLKLHNS